MFFVQFRSHLTKKFVILQVFSTNAAPKWHDLQTNERWHCIQRRGRVLWCCDISEYCQMYFVVVYDTDIQLWIVVIQRSVWPIKFCNLFAMRQSRSKLVLFCLPSVLIRKILERHQCKDCVHIQSLKNWHVHNAVPEIDIAVNSSRHGMSEKMKWEKCLCHF